MTKSAASDKTFLSFITLGLGFISLFLGIMAKLIIASNWRQPGTGINQAIGNSVGHLFIKLFGSLFIFLAIGLAITTIIVGIISLPKLKHKLAYTPYSIAGVLMAFIAIAFSALAIKSIG